MVLVVLPVLLGVSGLAIDMGNIYMAHSRLQAAVDAAALAGSLELPYDPDLDQGIVAQAAEEMLSANYPEAEMVGLDSAGEVRSVRVTGEITVPTLLAHALGISSSTVQASAAAGYNHLEIVFVIDNSGSMKGTPINMTKQAAGELVDLIMPDGTAPDTRFGLVPFRGKVRIGPGVDGLPAGCRNADGSVNETGLHDDWMPMYWELPYYYRYRIPEDTCSSIPQVKELSSDKESVIAAIDSQDAEGAASGTVISEGLKWGREVLTPAAPYDQGKDDDEVRKVIILLTDGDTEDGKCGGPYATYYDPNVYYTNAYYGMGDDTTHCENGGGLNQAMLDEAQAAKDEGIEIFAIRYGNSDNVDIELMHQVASSKPGTDDHYFDAPSAYDLDDIFKKIGRQLGWRLLN